MLIASKLSIMDIEKPIELDLTLQSAADQLPAVDITFTLSGNNFKSRKVEISDLSLKGRMTNHLDNKAPFTNRNSRINLREIKGNLMGEDHTCFL